MIWEVPGVRLAAPGSVLCRHLENTMGVPAATGFVALRCMVRGQDTFEGSVGELQAYEQHGCR